VGVLSFEKSNDKEQVKHISLSTFIYALSDLSISSEWLFIASVTY